MPLNAKNLLAYGSLAALFILIGAYAYFRTKNLASGVILNVSGLTAGQNFSEPLVSVGGRAKNARDFFINGRAVPIDKEGYFNESLLLLPGYNIMTLKASDKFGKSIKKNYQFNLN